MRAALFALLALGACSQQAPPDAQAAAAALQDCSTWASSTERTPGECRMEAAGQTLHVIFQPVAAGADAGNVTINVLNDGVVVQTLLEPDVFEYIAPTVQDVDGDGRADILAARESGNVNTVYGVWIFNGERGVYERVGDVSAVSIERTADGLIAAVARSSAAEWAIAFYKLDEGGLHPMATVRVAAPVSETPGCRLDEAPGLRDLNLTEAEAQTRFCAEPAAQVFSP